MLMADLGRRPGSVPAQPARQAQNWSVQVGVFRSHKQAEERIETVAHKFAKFFDDAVGKVDGGHRAYAAEFSGLSETAARDACSTVKSRGLPCEARGPV